MRFVETCLVIGGKTNGGTTETVFRVFLSTYNFRSGSEIPYVLIKFSIFSCLLFSTFVLFVMLALMYVSFNAIPVLSSFMPLSGLDQFHPISQRNPPPGPAAQRSSKREGEEATRAR